MDRLIGVGLVGLLTSGVAWAQEGTTTLPVPEVVQRARSQAPSMQVSQTSLESAEHLVGNAVSHYMPRVSVSDRETYRYNNPERYTYSYDVEQGGACLDPAGTTCLPVVVIDGTVTAPDNFWSNSLSLSALQPVIVPREVVAIRQAQGRVDLKRLEVKGDEEQLVMDLLADYFDLQAGEGERRVYEATLALDEEMERNLVASVDTGQAPALDLERARLDVEEARARLRQLDRQQALTAAALGLTAGEAPQASLRVCEAVPAQDTDQALSLQSATRLQILEQQVAMDRLSLKASRTSILPTLNVVGGLSFTGSGDSMEAVIESFMFDNWYVGGSLSLSLFEGTGRYHTNRAAQLDLDASQAKLDEQRAQMDLADRQSAQRLADLAEDLALLDRGIILAEANVRAVYSRYLAGTATFEMWVVARQSLEAQRLKRVATLTEQWKLVAWRWISAGQVDALIAEVERGDAAAAGRSACRAIAAAPLTAP